MKIVCLILMFGVNFIYAWDSNSEFEIAVTNALVQKNVLLSDSFGKQLVSHMESPISLNNAIEAKIIYSCRCMFLHNQTQNEDDFNNGFIAATNIYSSAFGITNSWVEWGTALMALGYYSSQRKYVEALQISTNVLHSIESGTRVPQSSIIGNVLKATFDMPNLSEKEIFLTMSAANAAQLGLTNLVLLYSSQIPERYKNMVLEIQESVGH